MEHSEAIRFYGSEILSLPKPHLSLINTFTIELWVRADRTRLKQQETVEGIAGTEGQRYVVGPGLRNSSEEASIGISIGSNGVSVYEHAEDHMPAVLVLDADLSEWTHIAVVYKDRTPYVYVNGILARAGVKSCRSNIYAASQIGGHIYGYYAGSINELRIWQTARTGEQIQSRMNQSLCEIEEGLYWYDNRAQGWLVNNGEKRDIYMSVIIPSHNKYPLNLLCLHTLMHQTFPSQHLEVVFIDDASNDGTSTMLDELNPSFVLKCIRTESNLGRSRVRNIGIRASIGKRILFLDAEMLVQPHTLEIHYQHHLHDQNRIISSCMQLKRIYTVLDPNYSIGQMKHIYYVYRNSMIHRKMIREFVQDKRSLPFLLSLHDLVHPHILDRYAYFHSNYDEIVHNFGNDLTHFHMSWLNFMTGSVSVSRSALFEAGLFDEQFIGFGMEDWELGYRLYKLGARYIHEPAAVVYHQEHPISSQNAEQVRANYSRFQSKHPDIGVLLLTLVFITSRSYTQLSGYIEDYQALWREPEDRFERLKAVIMELLKHAAQLYIDGHPVRALSSHQDHLLSSELNELRITGQHPRIVELYDHLISL